MCDGSALNTHSQAPSCTEEHSMSACQSQHLPPPSATEVEVGSPQSTVATPAPPCPTEEVEQCVSPVLTEPSQPPAIIIAAPGEATPLGPIETPNEMDDSVRLRAVAAPETVPESVTPPRASELDSASHVEPEVVVADVTASATVGARASESVALQVDPSAAHVSREPPVAAASSARPTRGHTEQTAAVCLSGQRGSGNFDDAVEVVKVAEDSLTVADTDQTRSCGGVPASAATETEKQEELATAAEQLRQLEESERLRKQSKDDAEREAAAIKIQSVGRARSARIRARAKRANAAHPIPKQVLDGCTFWEVTLTKRKFKTKYGFSHVNGRTEFLKERTYGDKLSTAASTPQSLSAARGRANAPSLSPSSSSSRVKSPSLLVGNGTVGHQLQVLDGPAPEVLVVKKVSEDGLLHEWNDLHVDAEVRPSDRICEVNNCRTIQEMGRELRSDSVRMMVLRYPEWFHIELRKQDGARRLGFKFERPANVALSELRITDVTPDCLLDESNTQYIDQGRFHYVVTGGMRIEAANDAEGCAAKIAEELRSCQSVRLRIRRAEVAAVATTKVRKRISMIMAMRLRTKSVSETEHTK